MKAALFIIILCFFSVTSIGQTKVVLLGTGTPNPDPQHSGSSIAILVNNNAYLVDFGAGIVRQAAKMTPQYGGKFPQLAAKNLKLAFLTHLHSDHTIGLPDLLLTPWVLERDVPLEIYGPVGTQHLAENIVEAYKADINYRLNGLEPANENGWQVNVHEFDKDGVIYSDSLIKVEAFKVVHGSWKNAFGFRFTTPDKTIVISGDTTPCENIIKYSKGADILIHEVYSYNRWTKRNEFWQKYHAANHTSTYELGELAAKAKPGKVVLYHILFWGDSAADLLNEIAERYDGEVIVGEDFMVIE
ncbi:MAG: MBL fold metallo-hydrolase [Draconibacterium sp.]|nr:MBL fold metallo-hydrolase [Draconibacterium sp.]